MIIKSHIRGGYRSAADYLKDQGKNEKTRLVEISDPKAKNLDDAFQKMWEVASYPGHCKKPLHHISINPMKDERLTDQQVLAIVARCEEKYGYRMFHHQRVIVEHVKDGRQHFHVIWNRVSLMTGRAVWPGEHWKKSKQVCREMEKELGLKRPIPRRMRSLRNTGKGGISTGISTIRVHKMAGASRRDKNLRQATTALRKVRPRSETSIKKTTAGEATAGKAITPATSETGSTIGKVSRGSRLAPGKAKKAKTARPTIKLTTGFKNSGSEAPPAAGRHDAPNPVKLPSGLALQLPLSMPFYVKPSKEEPTPAPAPFRPAASKKGWSDAASRDWELWGRLNPRLFFALWPELSL